MARRGNQFIETRIFVCVADPESTYLSFANPNYCFEDQVNFNLKEATTNNGHLAIDKLSLNSDDIHPADHQDYPNRYDNSRVMAF